MIISLSYKARVGKDTVADHLVEKHEFVKWPFAKNLKDACKCIFGFSNAQVDGHLKEVIDEFWGFTPRTALQQVGTDALRTHFDKEIWVRSLESRMRQFPRGTNFVIPDARFPNEVAAVKEWGGVAVKIERPIETIPEITSGAGKHSSEVALDDFHNWDYIIKNDGTFQELYRKVDNLIDLLSG